MRWVLGTVLACVAFIVMVGNLIGGIRARRSGKNFSAVPFVGAVLGSLAVLVLPVEERSWLLLAVLFLDFTIPMAAVALVLHVSRRPPR
jgi:predicted MFS family arabinose efflux permease